MKREQFEDAGQEMDRVRAAEAELQASPSRLFDRLDRLWGLHFGLAHFHANCVAQSSRYWPKEMLDEAKAKRDLHAKAARCVRRQIDRLVRKGVV